MRFHPAIQNAFATVILFFAFLHWSHIHAQDVVDIILMDSDSDEELFSLNDLDTVVLDEIGVSNISIKALTNPAITGSVKFKKEGSTLRVENIAPYAINGDNSGDFYPWSFESGWMELEVSAHSASDAGGTSGTAMLINILMVSTASDLADAGETPTVTPGSGDSEFEFPEPGVALPVSCSEFNILLFTKQNSTDPEESHSSIDEAINMFDELAESDNLNVFHTDDGSYFNDKNLNYYDLVVFCNTSGNNILSGSQRSSFTRFIRSGGGFMGIHSAANTETGGSWSWYTQLVGAEMNNHTNPESQGTVVISNSQHSSTEGLPSSFNLEEEFYNWKAGSANTKVNILLKLQPGSLVNCTQNCNSNPYPIHPLAWYQEFDGGRSFYTALGHKASLYSNDLFKTHIMGGIKWAASGTRIRSEFKKWHKVELTFHGDYRNESSTPNPFMDYKLDVRFSNGTSTFIVPGYYAASGFASENSATCGAKWRVNFSAPATGDWQYITSFREGNAVAIQDGYFNGSPSIFHGTRDTFSIAENTLTGNDFRAKGALYYNGTHYLRFAEDLSYFLKAGANSPENFLAYYEFDQTEDSHSYSPHSSDWNTGDPVWKGEKGKNIIGAVNYLASMGMNSIYFLTMNVNGDGDDVWPWTSSTQRTRYDVSKLDQWDILFSHMEKNGILMHVVTQEQENDQLLDGGNLGPERKLYYRELIARFGYHLGINWNLGEENTNTDAQRKAFATFIKRTDPFRHYINVHTYPWETDEVYNPLLSHEDVNGASIQADEPNDVHGETIKWIDLSSDNGLKWVVTNDEVGPASDGVLPDVADPQHNEIREHALWGNLMAGGAGVEWYFGYGYDNDDLNCEDWRSRESMWEMTKYAIDFFQNHIPFWQMSSHDELLTNDDALCLAKPSEVYAVYLPPGSTTNIDLASGNYSVKWYNPRFGGNLKNGTKTTVSGPGNQSIGLPPNQLEWDWVARISRIDESARQSSPGNIPFEIEPGLFPNPANDQARVRFELPEDMELQIRIIDITGKIVFSERGFFNAGWNEAGFYVESLANGFYAVELVSNNKKAGSGTLIIEHP